MEWRPEPPYWVARVPGGHYAVERWYGSVKATLTGPTYGREDFESVTAAKDAAQTHFQRTS